MSGNFSKLTFWSYNMKLQILQIIDYLLRVVCMIDLGNSFGCVGI